MAEDFTDSTPSPLEVRLRADLAEALALLAESALDPEQLSLCTGPDCCWDSRAHALLVRHGIRESQACPGSTLLAWDLAP